MKKFDLIIARTALVALPLSILSILINAVLANTDWGMNKLLWQVSWNVLALSILVLYLLIEHNRGKSLEFENSHKDTIH